MCACLTLVWVPLVRQTASVWVVGKDCVRAWKKFNPYQVWLGTRIRKRSLGRFERKKICQAAAYHLLLESAEISLKTVQVLFRLIKVFSLND